MPPQDQQPQPAPQFTPPTDNVQPPAPDQDISLPTTPAPSGGGKGKKLPIIIASVLLIAISAAGAYLLFFNKDSNDGEPAQTSQQPDETGSEDQDEDEVAAAACTASLAEFKSENLGIQFCYPSSWGTSEAKPSDEPVKRGSRYYITFARKSEVVLSLRSSDWEPEYGRGGACSDSSPDYTGSFNEDWADGMEMVRRDVAIEPGRYKVSEDASSFLGGVCLSAGVKLDASRYEGVGVSYFVSFAEDGSGGVGNDVTRHANSPNTLIPSSERLAFLELVKSIR